MTCCEGPPVAWRGMLGGARLARAPSTLCSLGPSFAIACKPRSERGLTRRCVGW